MDNTEKIVDRIRKLLALAGNNPNEHEAELAMKRAQALLAKYNMTLDSLPKDEKDKQEPYIRDTQKHYSFIGSASARAIAKAIAELYFCKMFYTSLGTKGEVYSYVGRQSNVAIAMSVSDMVLSQLRSQARQGQKIHGWAFISNFMRGASYKIYDRCQTMIEEASEGKAKDETGTTNLPALRNTYLAEIDGVKAYMLSLNVKLVIRAKGARGSKTPAAGFREGMDAGDKVNLRLGVENK